MLWSAWDTVWDIVNHIIQLGSFSLTPNSAKSMFDCYSTSLFGYSQCTVCWIWRGLLQFTFNLIYTFMSCIYSFHIIYTNIFRSTQFNGQRCRYLHIILWKSKQFYCKNTKCLCIISLLLSNRGISGYFDIQKPIGHNVECFWPFLSFLQLCNKKNTFTFTAFNDILYF